MGHRSQSFVIVHRCDDAHHERLRPSRSRSCRPGSPCCAISVPTIRGGDCSMPKGLSGHADPPCQPLLPEPPPAGSQSPAATTLAGSNQHRARGPIDKVWLLQCALHGWEECVRKLQAYEHFEQSDGCGLSVGLARRSGPGGAARATVRSDYSHMGLPHRDGSALHKAGQWTVMVVMSRCPNPVEWRQGGQGNDTMADVKQ